MVSDNPIIYHARLTLGSRYRYFNNSLGRHVMNDMCYLTQFVFSPITAETHVEHLSARITYFSIMRKPLNTPGMVPQSTAQIFSEALLMTVENSVSC